MVVIHQTACQTAKRVRRWAQIKRWIFSPRCKSIALGLHASRRSEKRDKCASELFHKFKSDAPELLASLFESMGLDLKTWQSWERHYGENRELMVAAFVCPEKHEAGELSLLRLKLSALGIDVDAINAVNAVRDYRDLKINFAELEKRTRHQISFRNEFLGLRADSSIPTEL